MVFGFLGCIYVYIYIHINILDYIYWMKLATTMGTCNINIHLLGINHGILPPPILSKTPNQRTAKAKKNQRPNGRLATGGLCQLTSGGQGLKGIGHLQCGVCHEGSGVTSVILIPKNPSISYNPYRPIPSMYGIFTYIWLFFWDPMGRYMDRGSLIHLGKSVICFFVETWLISSIATFAPFVFNK